MPQLLLCPSTPDLQRFLLGQLPDPDADSLGQHLEQCPHCLTTVAAIEADDTLVEAMRALGAAEHSEHALLKGLLGRVQGLGSSAALNFPKADTVPDEALRPRPSPEASPPGAACSLQSTLSEGLTPQPEDAGADAWAALETVAPCEQLLPADVAGLQETLAPPRPAPPASLLPNIGGYTILGVLGRGGMGVVYKARQPGLNRLVALKMIVAGSCPEPEELARFRFEAEALARLKHPHIVQIYEIGEHQGRPFLVLEYVDGPSLAEQIAGTPQNARAAAQLLETAARAVHAAHQCGVIHRDLKPANILLQQTLTAEDAEGAEGRQRKAKHRDVIAASSSASSAVSSSIPKITDFGLAKQVDHESGRTEVGQIMGTPSYMAPEQAQARHAEIGPATDVYALGAVLYELLTGRPPFRAETAYDTVMQVILEDTVPPRRLQPKVPRDLETIALKCLHKEPRRRYDTAQELADDLHRFLAGEPIHARPVGMWERGIKWARRRPVAAALVAVSAVALVGLLSSALFYGESQRQARRLTEQELKEDRRLAELRGDVRESILGGRTALAAGDAQSAKVAFNNAVKAIAAETKLAEFQAEAEGLLAEADRQLAEQQARALARGRLPEFGRWRDEALFHESQFSGLDRPANTAATRAAARHALNQFGAKEQGDAGSWTLDLGPQGSFNDLERAEITTACYELLLVLAEAVSLPLAGEDGRRQAEEALRVLGRAEQLRPATRALHLRRATYLTKVGKAGEAAQEQDRAAARQPEDAVDFFLLGDECYQRKDLAGAIGYFKTALRFRPDHFWAQYLLAVCYLRTQRPAEAEMCLNACQALRHGPQQDFIWVHLLRGFAHGLLATRAREAGRLTEAAFHFAAAETDFRHAETLRPDAEAAYVLAANRGVVRHQQNRDAEALADLKQAVDLKPDQSQAYLNLAKVYSDRKQFDDALAALDKAIAQQPELGVLYHARGQLHRDWRKLADALADFDETIRLYERNRARLTLTDMKVLADAHTERGKVLFHDKKYEPALRAFDAALRIQPDFATVYLLRGEVLQTQDNHKAAAAAYDQYLAQEPRPAAAVFEARGLVRAALKDYAGAVADYSRALDLEPTTRLYAHRGWTCLVMGALKAARADFDAAIRLDGKNSDAHNGRGYVLVQLGFVDQGVAEAREALRLGPPTSRNLWNAARTFAQAAGKRYAESGLRSRQALANVVEYQDEALLLLRQALDQEPDGKRAVFWRNNVQADPAFDPIRAIPGFDRLAKEYATSTASR